jgi:hypothetical protein
MPYHKEIGASRGIKKDGRRISSDYVGMNLGSFGRWHDVIDYFVQLGLGFREELLLKRNVNDNAQRRRMLRKRPGCDDVYG